MASGEIQEQVLVAALPNRSPEVHVASLNPAQQSISLKEAKICASGDISFGKETVVPLGEAEGVDVSEGNLLAILGRDGEVLCQLHLESAADQKAWVEGLRALISSSSGAAARRPAGGPGPGTEDTDDEVPLLQARSRQLQTQIGQMEAANERRDQQLDKMLRRLDSAMQMLSAVQDMCGQQRNVISAQQVAIAELTTECEEDEEEEEVESQGRASSEGLDEDASSPEMPQLVEARRPQRAAAGGSGSGEEQAAIDRLASLESEKEKFEGMLAASQNEHDDLLQKLEDMRSLMSMLGMQPPGDDDPDSGED